jgi:hypothetical protein
LEEETKLRDTPADKGRAREGKAALARGQRAMDIANKIRELEFTTEQARMDIVKSQSVASLADADMINAIQAVEGMGVTSEHMRSKVVELENELTKALVMARDASLPSLPAPGGERGRMHDPDSEMKERLRQLMMEVKEKDKVVWSDEFRANHRVQLESLLRGKHLSLKDMDRYKQTVNAQREHISRLKWLTGQDSLDLSISRYSGTKRGRVLLHICWEFSRRRLSQCFFRWRERASRGSAIISAWQIASILTSCNFFWVFLSKKYTAYTSSGFSKLRMNVQSAKIEVKKRESIQKLNQSIACHRIMWILNSRVQKILRAAFMKLDWDKPSVSLQCTIAIAELERSLAVETENKNRLMENNSF